MTHFSPTRRQFTLAALGAAGTITADAASAFNKPLGVQLYTVRNQIPKEAEATLKAVSDIGYREVEVIRTTLTQIGPLLKKYNLKPVSGHFETALILGNAPNGQTFEAALEEAKPYGLQYAVVPYLAQNQRGDLEYYKGFADKLNKAGETARKAGMQLAYHNHAFEFEGEAGKRPIDVLMQRTDKKLLGLEMDVFWVSVAGQDPVALLKQYAGRVPLVHLKDKAKDTPNRFNEGVPKETFKEVGNGSLDFAAILKAAGSAGAKHYFVEQDQTPGDPLASIRQSYQYLRGLKV